MNGLDCAKYKKSRQEGQMELWKCLMRIRQNAIVISFSKEAKIVQ